MHTVFLHHRPDGTVKILDPESESTDGPRVFGWYTDACVVLRSLGLWPATERANDVEIWTRNVA